MDKLKIRSIADVEGFERIPIEQRMASFTTYEMLKRGAAIDPDATAISFFASGDQYDRPEVVTYGRFMPQITRTANLFHDLGVGPRDVVSYLLPNMPQTHYILWGAEAAGIANPINPLLEIPTIVEICRSAGTKILVAPDRSIDPDIWQKALAVRKELPAIEAIILIGGSGGREETILSYDEVIENYRGDGLDSNRRIHPQEVASLYHTGGTTGTPKLAPHTHFNETAMALMFASSVELNTGEAVLCGLPLFHVNGTTVTGSGPFSIGAHVVILGTRGYRDPSVIENFFNIVARYRAVTFSAVPTVLSMLLDIPKRDADFSSLRYAICGAAPLSVELFKRFESHSGMKLLEGYGLTEGTCASSINPYHGRRKVGSIGIRLPYMQMKIFIVDRDGKFLREAETDEIGALAISGPNVFKGYLEDAHNQGIWAKEGWLNTGDLGRQDADGYFWLTGRRKELIIRGGHNIDPAIIEGPLYQLEGVKLAAAVGKPDAHAGEVPVAYVVLHQRRKMIEADILSYLKERIGERAAVPKEVCIVDEIPLTPVGKIFKPALRRQCIQRVYSAELQSLGDNVQRTEVSVQEDKVHGSIAEIAIKAAQGVSVDDLKRKVKDLLGRYTVQFRLRIE